MTVIDFQASWCYPCKMQEPVLDVMAQKYALDVRKVDVDTQPLEAQKFHVASLPTLVFVNPEGVELARTVGFTPKPSLDKLLAKLTA